MPYYLQVRITLEDKIAVEGKGIGRKLIDRLYQTYSSELGGKKFAYDGDKALYTLGPLPQRRLEFSVVLEETFAKQFVLLFLFPGLGLKVLFYSLINNSFVFVQLTFLCVSENGSPSGTDKRSRRSFQSKTFNVEISYAAEIPLKSIALALRGVDVDNTQDALKVLDIILRQQAANRYLSLSLICLLCSFSTVLCSSVNSNFVYL